MAASEECNDNPADYSDYSKEFEEEKSQEADSNEDLEIPFGDSLTTYGVDFTVEVIISKMSKKEFIIPEYQRNYVWGDKEASRFIESLLMGLPIPSIFLAKTADEKFLVLDGQQRLKTIEGFYNNQFPTSTKKGFCLKLDDTKNGFDKKAYKELDDKWKRKLNNAMLHITVVKQEQSDKENNDIYLVFERLNSGGKILVPQELRACLYRGVFNDKLKELNENEYWRKIFGFDKANSRQKDIEYILRFYAYYGKDEYKIPYKKFMNDFMRSHKDGTDIDDSLFGKTIKIVYQAFEDEPKKAFRFRFHLPREKFNAACFDSIMVALAKKVANGKNIEPDKVRELYDQLIENYEYQKYCQGPTANKRYVDNRFRIAEEAFQTL